MNEADVRRKLQDARRKNTAASWRILAKEFKRAGYHALAKDCEEAAIECELAELEKKN